MENGHNNDDAVAQSSDRARDTPTTVIRGFNSPTDTAALATSSETVRQGGDAHVLNRPRRRSSLAERVASIGDVGGVNSFNNFARSWQRAANFFEVTPVQRSYALHPDDAIDDESHQYRTSNQSQLHPPNSLLRAALEHDRYKGDPRLIDDSEAAIDDSESIAPSFAPASEDVRRRISERRSTRFDADSIFSVGSPYTGSYGTWSVRHRHSSKGPAGRPEASPARHIGSLFHQPSISSLVRPAEEQEPLLIKQVEEEEGKLVEIVVGHSTLPQTVFNSCNVLLGVGVLALPLAIRYSGWVVGMTFFALSAVVTSYTAKLLAKCLNVDNSLVTFADLAYVSFGPRARIAVSILFTVELVASCVALVIIFADSLDILLPGPGRTGFKILCGAITIPLVFTPLRYLSFTSILGILSCMAIFVAIFIDGVLKDHALGSLREPAQTYAFPANWHTVPMAFGLLMAPWGGHSVFPNIYRDMRHPFKYDRAVNITYIFTYLLEAALAVAGYMMFGESTKAEITANIFTTEGYPRWISIFILVAISIIPITKLPLNARPIISTLELFCGLDPRTLPPIEGITGSSGLAKGFLKVGIRIFTIVLFVAVAIALPSFDQIMSLLGSAACFTVCIILPCAFHLKIFGKELSFRQRCVDTLLIVVCSILAVVGTVYACVPKEVFGIN